MGTIHGLQGHIHIKARHVPEYNLNILKSKKFWMQYDIIQLHQVWKKGL